MIRIEMKRVLKEGLIILLIIAALFIAILKTDKDAYIAPAIELFLLLYASFSGGRYSTGKERKEPSNICFPCLSQDRSSS